MTYKFKHCLASTVIFALIVGAMYWPAGAVVLGVGILASAKYA